MNVPPTDHLGTNEAARQLRCRSTNEREMYVTIRVSGTLLSSIEGIHPP